MAAAAAAAIQSGNPGVFWMNDVSDEEQPLVFVPGLEGEVRTRTPFNLRPANTSSSFKRSTKMQGRRNSDCKNETTLKKGGKKRGHLQSESSEVSAHHSAIEATGHPLSLTTGKTCPSPQVIAETSRAKSVVCLKDLRPEDKRRIANLIEELARVSEEKEESVQRLKDEQENFGCKIQQLEQQNLIIAQERESLQQQYRECQELLGLYQQYLSQQQAKLNESIAQLSQEPAHSKVLSGEEVSSRTLMNRSNGSLFDGSYLGHAAGRSRQPQVHKSVGEGRAAVQNFGNPASLSCVGEFGPTDGSFWSQKRECRVPRHRCAHCQDNGCGTRRWKRDNCSHLENGFYQHECESENAICVEAKEALTRPLLGHEDWEEKRHQLLLQKMQLEVEREKLQARLAEQEQRLSRQNQLLRQSRLDSSGFQQATPSDLSSSIIRNGDPQPEGPSHQGLPSSAHEGAEVPPELSLHEKQSQTLPTHPDNSNEALELSRKDMATSPDRSHPTPTKSIPVSVSQKTPEARLDFSMVELLDIFTPASAPAPTTLPTQRPRVPQHRPALTVPKPAGRTVITHTRPYPHRNQQDLEESQILEDIFFIC